MRRRRIGRILGKGGALRRLVIGGGLTAVCAIAAWAHEGHAPLPTKGATVQGEQLLLSERARRAIGVSVEKIELGSMSRTIRARGWIQLPWKRQALITTLVPGRVASVPARPGDHVEPGAILATIEGLELETLQRDWLRAEAEHGLTERLLAQREELADSNAITVSEVLEARRDERLAASEVEIAIRKLLALGITESELERVRRTGDPIRFLPMRSPIAGELVHADVREGQVVATDEHLFHVVDPGEVEVAGEVLEADLGEIAIGRPVTAEFAGLPGARFSGRIEHTHLRVEPSSRALVVIAHLENSERRLKPGMSGTLEIRVAHDDQAVICPEAAITGTSSRPRVFVEREEGRYERRELKLGTRSAGRVEVIDGLFPGDRVVVVGTGLMSALFPSDPVGSPAVALRPAVLVTRGSSGESDARSAATLSILGEVELPVARRRVVESQVEGRIVRILVDPGEEVAAGQVLAEVESLSLRNLQLDLAKTLARHRWTSDEAERTRRLSERNVAARDQLWRIETNLESMRQTMGEIRSQLSALGIDGESLSALEASELDREGRARSLSMTIPLRAPAAGRLDHFDVVPGQVVRPAEPGESRRERPLFEIHDRSRYWVRGYVRERDASRIRLGLPARASFAALPGGDIDGVVIRMSPILEDATRVMPIWIEVSNPDGRLFEGMKARISIDTSSAADAIGPRPSEES